VTFTITNVEREQAGQHKKYEEPCLEELVLSMVCPFCDHTCRLLSLQRNR